MVNSSLRREIVDFVSVSYTQERVVSTVRDILKYFWISRDAFYDVFPGGMKEVCREAGVPILEERYRAVARANAARRKIARLSDPTDIRDQKADNFTSTTAQLPVQNTASSHVIAPANTTTKQEPNDWMKWQCEVHGPILSLEFGQYLGLTTYVESNGQVVWWKHVTPEYIRQLLDYAQDAT